MIRGIVESVINGLDQENVLIVSFHGWSDAGSAATTAANHLAKAIDATPLHIISSDGYVDMQMYRPVITTDFDGNRRIEWPDSRLLGPPHDFDEPGDSAGVRPLDGHPMPRLYFFDGTEPAQLWQTYTDEVVDLIEAWDFDLVVLLGSMFSDAPHSRPIPITVTSDDQELRARFDAQKPDYEGPIGIASVLLYALESVGVPTVSLWAQVPHYVHSSPSPKATLALLDRLEELLNIVIPRGSLLEEANDWEANIDSLASQDIEMTTYIERLEEARDSVEGPSTTGDAIAYELEKFLRADEEDE